MKLWASWRALQPSFATLADQEAGKDRTIRNQTLWDFEPHRLKF